MVIPFPIILSYKLIPMEPENKNISAYRMYFYTFTSLAILTLVEVWLIQISMPSVLMVGLILAIAVLQAAIVLMYNMHLKFQEKIFAVFIGILSFLILVLIVFTMLDYIYR